MKATLIAVTIALGTLAPPARLVRERLSAPVTGYGAPITREPIDPAVAVELDRAAAELAADVAQDRTLADLSFQLGRLDAVLSTMEQNP